MVDLYRVTPEKLEGRCPPLLQDFLEVRGLGILNIRALFGDHSVKPAKSLDIIMQLEKLEAIAPHMQDRLKIKEQYQTILEVTIPKAVIPVAAGRNIAVLVEVAVRNHVLRMRGIDSTSQFLQRQSRELRRNAAKLRAGEK